MGPIEYMVIGFEGNHFSGEIVPEITALTEAGTVRILDLILVGRNESGDIFSAEVLDIPEMQAGIESMRRDLGQWFAEDDIEEIAESVPAGSSVALLLVEHLWAERLADSIRRANGKLLAQTRIPADLIDEVQAMLETAPEAQDIEPAEEYRRAA